MAYIIGFTAVATITDEAVAALDKLMDKDGIIDPNDRESMRALLSVLRMCTQIEKTLDGYSNQQHLFPCGIGIHTSDNAGMKVSFQMPILNYCENPNVRKH